MQSPESRLQTWSPSRHISAYKRNRRWMRWSQLNQPTLAERPHVGGYRTHYGSYVPPPLSPSALFPASIASNRIQLEVSSIEQKSIRHQSIVEVLDLNRMTLDDPGAQRRRLTMMSQANVGPQVGMCPNNPLFAWGSLAIRPPPSPPPPPRCSCDCLLVHNKTK